MFDNVNAVILFLGLLGWALWLLERFGFIGEARKIEHLAGIFSVDDTGRLRAHYEERADFYAYRHPSMVVRHLGQLLIELRGQLGAELEDPYGHRSEECEVCQSYKLPGVVDMRKRVSDIVTRLLYEKFDKVSTSYHEVAMACVDDPEFRGVMNEYMAALVAERDKVVDAIPGSLGCIANAQLWVEQSVTLQRNYMSTLAAIVQANGGLVSIKPLDALKSEGRQLVWHNMPDGSIEVSVQ